MTQLDQQGAAIGRGRRVCGTRGVLEVGARAVISLFVGEHAFEHQDLFAEIVHMSWKAGACPVANHRRRARDLVAVTLEHASANAGRWRFDPRQLVVGQTDPETKIRVEFHALTCSHCAGRPAVGMRPLAA